MAYGHDVAHAGSGPAPSTTLPRRLAAAAQDPSTVITATARPSFRRWAIASAPKPGEHRQTMALDSRRRARGGGVRQVGQVHADHVAAADAEAAQAPGEAAGLAVQIGEGPGGHCTVFALPYSAGCP
jgi:hypothetical protein